MDLAVVISGSLSFTSLVFYYLALHDIRHDYASPEVWARAGQNLPSWYDPVNRCPAEWGILRVGFLMMLSFHILPAARFLFARDKRATSQQSDFSTPA